MEDQKNNEIESNETLDKEVEASSLHTSDEVTQINNNDTTEPNFILADEKVEEQSEADQTKMMDTTSEEEPHTDDNDTDTTSENEIPVPPKQSSTKRYRTPFLIASCLLLGGVGGFGGSYLANKAVGSGSDKVILQTVERKDSDGNKVTNMSVKDVVANTANSVVEITTESATTDSVLQQYVTKGAGSGVIISEDGYIVTNNHVVDGASKIKVRTKSGEEYDATLIGRDEKTDLAILKIDAKGLTPAVLGNSADLAVGESAIAIGNPLGELGGTVTEGIISALDREITIDGKTMTLLQTDTAINSGNSGGGLFNTAGELIGIVNAKSSGTSVEGLGFAIPIDTAKSVIEALINDGYVSGRPQLGVSIINVDSETTAFQAGVDEMGVYIAKVTPDSAADKAGLKMRDRVISVDGKEIKTPGEITKIVDSKKVGDSITLVISRDGEQKTITAILQEAIQDEESSSDEQPSNQQGNNGSQGLQ